MELGQLREDQVPHVFLRQRLALEVKLKRTRGAGLVDRQGLNTEAQSACVHPLELLSFPLIRSASLFEAQR